MSASWWVGLSRLAFSDRVREELPRMHREAARDEMHLNFLWAASSGDWRAQNRNAWLTRQDETHNVESSE